MVGHSRSIKGSFNNAARHSDPVRKISNTNGIAFRGSKLFLTGRHFDVDCRDRNNKVCQV